MHANPINDDNDDETGGPGWLDDFDIPDRDARAKRIEERVLRCVRAMLIGMNRDYERCGKAACARSRRCRGYVCDENSLMPSS
jgi:hypothetical protein